MFHVCFVASCFARYFAHELCIDEELGIFPSPKGAWKYSKTQSIYDNSHTLHSMLRQRPLCRGGAWNFSKANRLYREEALRVFPSPRAYVRSARSFSKSHGLYIEEELRTFPSPRVYVGGESSECFSVQEHK